MPQPFVTAGPHDPQLVIRSVGSAVELHFWNANQERLVTPQQRAYELPRNLRCPFC